MQLDKIVDCGERQETVLTFFFMFVDMKQL